MHFKCFLALPMFLLNSITDCAKNIFLTRFSYVITYPPIVYRHSFPLSHWQEHVTSAKNDCIGGMVTQDSARMTPIACYHINTTNNPCSLQRALFSCRLGNWER